MSDDNVVELVQKNHSNTNDYVEINDDLIHKLSLLSGRINKIAENYEKRISTKEKELESLIHKSQQKIENIENLEKQLKTSVQETENFLNKLKKMDQQIDFVNKKYEETSFRLDEIKVLALQTEEKSNSIENSVNKINEFYNEQDNFKTKLTEYSNSLGCLVKNNSEMEKHLDELQKEKEQFESSEMYGCFKNLEGINNQILRTEEKFENLKQNLSQVEKSTDVLNQFMIEQDKTQKNVENLTNKVSAIEMSKNHLQEALSLLSENIKEIKDSETYTNLKQIDLFYNKIVEMENKFKDLEDSVDQVEKSSKIVNDFISSQRDFSKAIEKLDEDYKVKNQKYKNFVSDFENFQNSFNFFLQECSNVKNSEFFKYAKEGIGAIKQDFAQFVLDHIIVNDWHQNHLKWK